MLVSFSAQTCLHQTWWPLINKFLRLHCDWERVRIDTLRDAIGFCNLLAVLHCSDETPDKARFYWIIFYKHEKSNYFVHAIGKRHMRLSDVKIMAQWAALKKISASLIFVNKHVLESDRLRLDIDRNESTPSTTTGHDIISRGTRSGACPKSPRGSS